MDGVEHEIVSEGLNDSQSNPTLHGEMDAINNYAATGSDRWHALCLYTTAEPCVMCQSAILWAGIPKVVYGTSVIRLVEFGFNQFSLRASDVVANAPFANCELIGGVCSAQCDELFRNATSH